MSPVHSGMTVRTLQKPLRAPGAAGQLPTPLCGDAITLARFSCRSPHGRSYASAISSRSMTSPPNNWSHLRTTNPIESTFATTRLRHRKAKGSGTRRMSLAIMIKLAQTASKKWRRQCKECTPTAERAAAVDNVRNRRREAEPRPQPGKATTNERV